MLNKIVGFLGGLSLFAIFFVLFFAYGCWSGALVITYLWAWFIVPLFHVAPLSLAQALGVMVFVGYITYHHSSNYAKDERKISEKVAECVGLLLRPWFCLLVGYFIHHCLM